jgi:hypothetical protein
MMNHELLDIAQMASTAVPRLWGYLDPGMGSMVLQVVLASVLSASFFLKTWVRQVRHGLLAWTKKS